MELTLAEQLLLLAFDEEKGRDASWQGIEAGLAGALLLDLTRGGYVREDDEGDLVAAGDADPDEPLLSDARRAISGSEKRRDARGWVDRLPKDVKPIKERDARARRARRALRGAQQDPRTRFDDPLSRG